MKPTQQNKFRSYRLGAFSLLAFASIPLVIVLSSAYSLFSPESTMPAASAITAIVFFGFMFVALLVGVNTMVRHLYVQGTVLTEERGLLFKKRTTFDLRSTTSIVALGREVASSAPWRRSYGLLLTSPTSSMILHLHYYHHRQWLDILEVLRPVLRNASIKKTGPMDLLLDRYFPEYHPHLDQQTNTVNLEVPDLRKKRRANIRRSILWAVAFGAGLTIAFVLLGLAVNQSIKNSAICDILESKGKTTTAKVDSIKFYQQSGRRSHEVSTIEEADSMVFMATYIVSGQTYTQRIGLQYSKYKPELKNIYQEAARNALLLRYNPDNPNEVHPAEAFKDPGSKICKDN